MINGDSSVWLDATTKHSLLMTDGTVTVSGEHYTVSGATVTIDNNILDSNAFTLRQSLSKDNQLRFGSCSTAAINFTIHENIPTIKDKVLKVYFLPSGDASKMVQIGVFKIYEDNLLADRTKRSITGYDAMYDVLNTDVSAWYNTLLPSSTSSVTLAQFRASLLNYFGITAESTTLANDDMVIKRTIEPETLSGANVIKAICEINGVFGVINNEGNFRFVELSPGIDDGLFPSDTLYPADDLYPQDVNSHVTPMPKAYYMQKGTSFEDYDSESIDGLTIRTNEKDVGTTVGSGNTYIISGNFLVFGKNATELRTIGTNTLNKMHKRYYKPCVIKAVGNPLHEVGDPIRINTVYRGVVTYILERTLTGIQSLVDTYTARGERVFSEPLNSLSDKYKQLSGAVTTIEKDTDGLRVYVEEQLDDTVSGSYANITANEIALKVSKSNIVGDLDDKMDSNITITPSRISFTSSGTLVINTSNLKLDASGNAEFSGLIRGAQIESGSNVIARDVYGSHASVMGSSGFATGEVTQGGIDANNAIDIDGPSRVIRVVKSGVGSTIIEPDEISVRGGSNYSSLTPTGLTAPNIQANSSLTVYGSVTIVGSSATINNHAILTDDSTINVNKLTGQINSNTNITFGKYLNAVGTSADYELKLQTITINGTRYVMYAEEQP